MLARTSDRLPPARLRDPEEVALNALTYIVYRRGELADFLFDTGMSAETVRDVARTPAFLAGVLDYVVANPRVLKSVAADQRTTKQAIDEARRALLPQASVTPVQFGPGPLVLRCEKCGCDRDQDRARWLHLPARVAVVQVPRCAACGGGFDRPETWLDADGREL